MRANGRFAAAATLVLLASSASWGEPTNAGIRSVVLAEHTINGQPIACVTQADGVRVCHGEGKGPDGPDLRLKSFDGTPLALYVTLPAPPSSGTDGNYPLVIQSHGWGDPTNGPDDGQ